MARLNTYAAITTTATNDVFVVDGDAGTKTLSATAPKFLTSVTVPTLTSAAGANLAISVGTAASGITAFNGTTDASNSTTAAITMAGGLAVAKKIFTGSDVTVGQTLYATATGQTQAQFNGWSTISGISAGAGQINIGTGSTDLGKLSYEGDGSLRLTAMWDNAASAVQAWVRGAGTPVKAAEFKATSATLAGNLTVSGTGTQTLGGAASTTVVQNLTTQLGRTKHIRVVTTTYTVDGTSKDEVIIGNHATVGFTVTMIAASTNTGRSIVFKNKGAATVTLDATALGQIFTTSAVDTLALATGDAVTLVSDGTIWNVI